ncbi:MAG: DUF3106 domain-containing protein, partial [Chromatiales bacterium]
ARVRKNFQRFREMTPEQRQKLQQRWRQLTPEQRQKLLDRRRQQRKGTGP